MEKDLEWDENKRRINVAKHGFDFVGVETVFEGTIVTIEDTRFEYAETRFITIGMWNARVVVIAHTEDEKKIRIISIRKATKNEEKQFLQELGYELEED